MEVWQQLTAFHDLQLDYYYNKHQLQRERDRKKEKKNMEKMKETRFETWHKQTLHA